jgi:hypothetical protein
MLGPARAMICPLVRAVDEVVQDAATAALIQPDVRADVAALARRLPEAMHGFGFELRLAGDREPVDFYTSVVAQSGGREVLGAFRSLTAERASASDVVGWDRVAAFARRWADPTSALHASVVTAFLEFDAPFAGARPPSLFARLDPPIGDGWQQWAAGGAVVDEIVALLLGRAIDPATRARLTQVFATLPPGGRVIDVAAMLPRGMAAVRVFVTLPRSGLLTYLSGLGYTDGLDALASLPEGLWRGHDHLSLQMDVAETIGPRIGVELNGDASEPASSRGWPVILGALRRAGLCSAAREAALLAWPGVGPPRATAGAWPSQVVRVLSHVKLVIQPAQPVEAKAYLWATARPAGLTWS